MKKFQREDISTRLKKSSISRVNYFKLNQGYDFGDQDSEYDDDQESFKVAKKIKKEKVKTKQKCGHDDLQILLKWKKDITCQPYETDKSRIHILKKVAGTDLSIYQKDVQGILINSQFKKEFKNLDLSRKLLPNGIVFIWSDKTQISEMLRFFEKQGFVYIENLVIVQISLKKTLSELNKIMTIEQTEQAVLQNLGQLKSIKDLMESKTSKILNTTKKVLMMFRRFDEQKSQLELRHQRTPDVLFDLDTPNSQKSKEYIYQMIETLLPKSQLMEIYAEPNKCRKGWASICQQ